MHEAQNFFGAEIIGGTRAQVAARADFGRAAPRLAQGLDLLAEDAVEFRFRVAREQPFARRELHGVGQRIVEFFEDRFGVHFAAGKLPLEFRGQPQEKLLVRGRMHAPQAHEVGGLVEPALADAPRGRIQQQDADVDPLVANQIRLVAHHVIGAGV